MEWTAPKPHSSIETFENKQKSSQPTLPEFRKTVFDSRVNAGRESRKFKDSDRALDALLVCSPAFPRLAAAIEEIAWAPSVCPWFHREQSRLYSQSTVCVCSDPLGSFLKDSCMMLVFNLPTQNIFRVGIVSKYKKICSRWAEDYGWIMHWITQGLRGKLRRVLVKLG